jgi:hypothetical protein
MRALVPAAVLLLTCTALISHFSPGTLEAQAASQRGALSTRGLWADERGNTVLVTERVAELSSRAIPNAELRFLGPDGRTSWVMPLGSGAITTPPPSAHRSWRFRWCPAYVCGAWRWLAR